MSAYRQHPQGATAGMREISGHRNSALMFKMLPASLPPGLHPICRQMRLKHMRMMANEQELQGQAGGAHRTMIAVLLGELVTFTVRRSTLVWVLRLSFPRLHRLSVRLRGSA
jgi:hypothetical protein